MPEEENVSLVSIYRNGPWTNITIFTFVIQRILATINLKTIIGDLFVHSVLW